MQKKKIAVLHAQVPFVRGGAELMVENLTRELCARGYDAELVSIPLKWYPNHTLLDSYLMWRMVDLTESNGQKIDLVIGTKTPTYLARHPNKVLWLMHQERIAYDLADNVMAGGLNTIPGGMEVQRKIVAMDNLAIPEAKLKYAISQNVSNRLKQYNGLDAQTLYHPPGLAGRYYTEEYGDYILSVGRLDKKKRVDLMIAALQYCDKRITAIIGGKGNELEPLQRYAEKLGVADRVKFLGFVSDEDVLKLYANALGVYFAPLDEDYGYITLEAFLSHRPVVTSLDAGGVLEFARHGENAYVTEAEAEALGQSFDRLFHDKQKARDFGIAGYETVKDISWDTVVEQLTQTLR